MPHHKIKGLGMGFGKFGPPTEILTIELIYALIVFSLCIFIIYQTREIYKLTKHKGIFYFRNIFLFFSLAYLVRAIMISIPLLTEANLSRPPIIIGLISFLLVSYFSTMAILSLVMTLIYKKLKFNQNKLFIFLNLVTIFFSALIFITRSNQVLILVQTIIFLFSVIYILSKQKQKKKSLLSQNKVTYTLLFIFWLLNIVASVRFVVPREFKIPLYIISAGIFFSIFIRVRKRLHHAKKTRQA